MHDKHACKGRLLIQKNARLSLHMTPRKPQTRLHHSSLYRCLVSVGGNKNRKGIKFGLAALKVCCLLTWEHSALRILPDAPLPPGPSLAWVLELASGSGGGGPWLPGLAGPWLTSKRPFGWATMADPAAGPAALGCSSWKADAAF